MEASQDQGALRVQPTGSSQYQLKAWGSSILLDGLQIRRAHPPRWIRVRRLPVGPSQHQPKRHDCTRWCTSRVHSPPL